MTTALFGELVNKFETGGTVYAGEFADDLHIPILSGPQCQGDVMILPWTAPFEARVAGEIGRRGCEIIRGGAMNNAHTLRTLDAGVIFTPEAPSDGGTVLGYLHVPEGSVCFLEHPEHGFNGIGAGTYRISRQREMADRIRLVAD